ncbi:MAG: flagellar biosynthetic protein FliR [Fuerstiella sp.]
MDAILLPVILCFFRVASFVAFLPPFGGQHMPKTVKVGLAMALTLFWAPNIAFSEWVSETSSAATEMGVEPSDAGLQVAADRSSMRPWLLWAWLGARETLLGASLGWVLGMILIPFRVAGSWLGELMGITIASITSGADSSSGNVLAVFFEAIGVLMLFALDIHHGFLLIFNRCWDTFQVGGMWKSGMTHETVHLITQLPAQGLTIAAPMALFMTIATIVLLFAMKQAPQFNLFTFGMPFRLLAGMGAILLFFPDLMAAMTNHLQTFLNITG